MLDHDMQDHEAARPDLAASLKSVFAHPRFAPQPAPTIVVTTAPTPRRAGQRRVDPRPRGAAVGRQRLRNVAALAELEPSQAAQTADLLAGAGILAPGRPLRFRHPIIEGAIYAELLVSERSRMHMNAARLLAETGAATERAASHVFVSEPSGNPWSVGVLRAAAAAAVARGAPESALSYLERAEREGPDADVRGALVAERGSVEFLLGEPAMFDHLREAIVVSSEPSARGRIAQTLASALLFAGRAREGVSVLERALDDVGDTDPMLARAIEAELLAMASQHLSTRAAHARHLSLARALELGDNPSDRLLLANLALWNSTEGERASVVRALAERALADGQLLEEVTADSQAFYIAAAALFQCDALQLCRYWLDQALADARARGSLIGFALASCWRSDVCYRLGELADAEADARAAIQAAGGDAWVLAPAALAFLAQALIEGGELAEADRVLTGSRVRFGMDQPMPTNWLPFARAQLQIARGDLRLAVENLLCCGEWLDAWGVRNPALLDWRTPAGFAFARLGELDRARGLSGELLAQTESLEQPRSHAIALRTAGLITGGADGIDSLREAVAMIANTPARLEHARTLIDLGAALRRLNHRKDAREPLRQGTELAQRCGATLLAQRGQTELIATGARPRQLAVSGADALTASERRVAQLAADGLSSPQIAQQLFVTVNTVETHLRHAYQKLSIHSRVELPAALASPSPSDPTAAAPSRQQPQVHDRTRSTNRMVPADIGPTAIRPTFYKQDVGSFPAVVFLGSPAVLTTDERANGRCTESVTWNIASSPMDLAPPARANSPKATSTGTRRRTLRRLYRCSASQTT